MEKFYRNKISYKETEIEIQALNWKDINKNGKFHIYCFGVSNEGNSVFLDIENFTPFFYVKLPDNFTKPKIDDFIDTIGNSKFKDEKNNWVSVSDYIVFTQCKVFNKKDFYGFRNDETSKFLRLVFNNSLAMKRATNVIRQHNTKIKVLAKFIQYNLDLYESNIENFLRFIHIKNLQPTGWLNAKNISITSGISNCQIEATVDWKNITFVDKVSNAPILQASYDIEVYNQNNSFNPEDEENVITHIGTSFKILGENDFLFKSILCLKKHKDITDISNNLFMECFDTEKELIEAWEKLIINSDTDIIYSYNGDNFDGNYIYVRAKKNGITLQLGKIKDDISIVINSTFSSSAYGDNNYKRLVISGRINFDVLIFIKRNYKEVSYKLDDVSKKYINASKNPITPNQMFKAFRENNPEELKEVASYCIQDTVLPQLLSDKLGIFQEQISMSNITYVPIDYLLQRGQSIKVFSQIIKETSKNNYLIPTMDYIKRTKEDEDGSFTGATVLTPIKGAYTEPIVVLDFASLYPSIIRAHNLCYSTIILQKKYNNLEGLEYENFVWEDNSKHDYTFVQNKPGILPNLLEKLGHSRKSYKKLMAEAEDPFMKEVYNKCQLAVKVSMNSIYGFLAAPMLCCKPIAATTTFVGRRMINNTKNYVEQNYNASTIVYGDSVSADTPILLRNPINGDVLVKQIQQLNKEWVDYSGFKLFDLHSRRKHKQQGVCLLQAWTSKGWQNIKRVIRHKCNKKMYRISTNQGIVDVTEDHSLLNEELIPIKPEDCIVGSTKLYNLFPDYFFTNSIIPQSTAFTLGVFMNKGTINCENKWMLKDLNVLDYNDIYANLMKSCNEKYKFITITKSYNDGLYNIECNDPKIIEDYKKLFYDNSIIKQVPSIILNGDENTKYFFLYGYIGTKSIINNGIHYNTINKVSATKMYIIMKSVKINAKVSVRNGIYSVKGVGEENLEENVIQKIELLNNDIENYVYDLETYTGNFCAGVGSVIVKNTDSVFIKFDTEKTKKYVEAKQNKSSNVEELRIECLEEAMELGKEAAKNATKALFKNPISLEFEKVFLPLFLLSKKRYIGRLYENDPNKFKLKNSGLILTRRDNFDLLKITYTKIMDKLLDEEKYEEIEKYVRNVIQSIRNGEIPIEQLITSRSLKNDYKSKNLPHLTLSNKLNERHNTTIYQAGDRIPYVFLDPSLIPESNNGKRKIPQFLKVEDPEYASKHNLKLDVEYYIKFMSKSIIELLSLFIDNPEEIFEEIEEKPKRKKIVRKIKN